MTRVCGGAWRHLHAEVCDGVTYGDGDWAGGFWLYVVSGVNDSRARWASPSRVNAINVFLVIGDAPFGCGFKNRFVFPPLLFPF